MRVTKTVRQHNRAALAAAVRDAPAGTRVTFSDPESTHPQKVKLRIMLDELARKVEWHGEKLTVDDWRTMFLAGLRGSHVVHGVVPGTRVVLFERKSDEPSVKEASEMIEMINAFLAERGL